MPTSSHAPRRMSAAPGHPLLRSRIADVISNHIDERGQRPVARDLGVAAGSTIGRWGADLMAWPLLVGLDLGVIHPPLRDAIIAYLDGEHSVSSEPIRAPGALIGALQQMSVLTGEIATALSDRRITPHEARMLLNILNEMRRQQAEVLIPALESCVHA